MAVNGVEDAIKNKGVKFIYTFFPFMIDIYPYAEVTDKKRETMEKANIHYLKSQIWE